MYVWYVYVHSCMIEPLPAYMFYPSIDGVEITDAPWVLLRDGALAPGVDILLGSNRDDVVTSHIHPPCVASPALLLVPPSESVYHLQQPVRTSLAGAERLYLLSSCCHLLMSSL